MHGWTASAGQPRDNPPHLKAYNRYSEVVDEVIVTMSWPSGDAVAPVVFAVDENGARIIREADVEEAAEVILSKSLEHAARSLPMGRRLAAVAAAATLALLREGPAYRAAALAQLGLLAGAAAGARVRLRPLLLARYYVATTAALGAGLYDHLRHGTPAVWEAAEGTR